MNEQDRRQYLFGTYVLDLAKASLFRGGEVVFLGRRSFETLRYFVLNPSRVITKEDLLKNVWSGAHVVENNVDRQISNLRKVLGTTTDSREYIETIRGDGFRFTVDVQVRESPRAGAFGQ
jgi:DNA-binding winged helix-turn-helix (wHTH) protein